MTQGINNSITAQNASQNAIQELSNEKGKVTELMNLIKELQKNIADLEKSGIVGAKRSIKQLDHRHAKCEKQIEAITTKMEKMEQQALAERYFGRSRRK